MLSSSSAPPSQEKIPRKTLTLNGPIFGEQDHYSAFLIEEEGTASTFRALKEVFSERGLPMSLYTDRGPHYFRTTKAGEIDRGSPTQVGRALEQLGVEHIGAFSPPHSPSRDGRPSRTPFARGRSERAFQTLQDRLVKELRLAGRHRQSRRPTPSSATSICRPTTRALRFLRPAKARPSRPSGGRSRRDPVRRGGAAGRQRQLRLLPDAEAADPREPDAGPLRQGAGQGPPYPDGTHAIFHGRASAATTRKERSETAKNAA